MSRRTWLVAVSIVGHAALGVGLFASGIWKLERLESDRRLAGIGILTPTLSSGGAPELPEAKFQNKEPKREAKRIARHVQWDRRVVREEPSPTTPGGGGDGPEGPDLGTTVGPPCALPPCEGTLVPIPEPPRPPAPLRKPPILTPTQMTALRIAGDTQIHPSRTVKNQMVSDGKLQVTAAVRYCIATTGAVDSAALIGSTRYPEYDDQLLAAVRQWRYRPHLVNGVPTPACSAVSFVYAIK